MDGGGDGDGGGSGGPFATGFGGGGSGGPFETGFDEDDAAGDDAGDEEEDWNDAAARQRQERREANARIATPLTLPFGGDADDGPFEAGFLALQFAPPESASSATEASCCGGRAAVSRTTSTTRHISGDEAGGALKKAGGENRGAAYRAEPMVSRSQARIRGGRLDRAARNVTGRKARQDGLPASSYGRSDFEPTWSQAVSGPHATAWRGMMWGEIGR